MYWHIFRILYFVIFQFFTFLILYICKNVLKSFYVLSVIWEYILYCANQVRWFKNLFIMQPFAYTKMFLIFSLECEINPLNKIYFWNSIYSISYLLIFIVVYEYCYRDDGKLHDHTFRPKTYSRRWNKMPEIEIVDNLDQAMRDARLI